MGTENKGGQQKIVACQLLLTLGVLVVVLLEWLVIDRSVAASLDSSSMPCTDEGAKFLLLFTLGSVFGSIAVSDSAVLMVGDVREEEGSIGAESEGEGSLSSSLERRLGGKRKERTSSVSC